jgi:hypothetical protein
MERIRFRPLVLALVLATMALAPLAAVDVQAIVGRETATELPFQVNAALLPNSKENTSVIAQNNGSAASTIAMDVYTPGGVLIPTASKIFSNVPPGGTRVFPQAINDGLSPGFRGVGIISSDQPVNALLVRDIESSAGVKSYSIHNSYATGGNTVSLPFISNSLDGLYNTRFAIANTGNATACVSVTYSFVPGAGAVGAGGRAPFTDSGSGGSGCGTGYPVPVGGQISFAPNNVDGAIPMPGTTSNALMAATVTSTGSPVTVGVDAYRNGQRVLASYDGFIVGSPSSTTDDLGTEIAIPLSLKTADGYFSQILLSNPNNVAASATITYTGNTGTHTVTITVPANGTANHGVYSDSTVPVGFVGAARVTSTQPLAAVLFRMKMTTAFSFVDEPLYTAVNGLPTDRATTTAKFPLIFRRAYQSGSRFGYNSWVSVSVADGGSANVTVTTVNDPTAGAPGCGAPATYVTTKTVNGSFIFYQNLDGDNGLGANPACLWGGMTITSDRPIIAIANVTNDLNQGDNDGLYNAFGQ